MATTQLKSSGRVAVRPNQFTGVKVFSATMLADRARLGETVSAWIAEHEHLDITDIVVTQSSDCSFHCIAISVFFR